MSISNWIVLEHKELDACDKIYKKKLIFKKINAHHRYFYNRLFMFFNIDKLFLKVMFL